MAIRDQRLKAELIEAVVAQVRARLAPDRVPMVERFVRAFYANTPPADMVEATPDKLYGAALALWQFGAKRPARTPMIRVYSPTIAEHSWQSSHSVVEIVNDDMPFLVASVVAALRHAGDMVLLVIHPVLRVRRDADGHLIELRAADDAAGDPVSAEFHPESWVHVTIDRQTDARRLQAVTTVLHKVLEDCRLAVEDWSAMRRRTAALVCELEARADAGDEIREAADFLRWVDDENFTFLGCRNYRFVRPDGTVGAEGANRLEVVAESGLGVLRDPGVRVFDGLRDLAELPPEVQYFLRQPAVVWVTKANHRATVHRAVHMDAILLKELDAQGRVIGERLILGLFTSAAYSRAVSEVPLLRRKAARVVARAGFDLLGHDGKRLLHILANYPRDELFQSSDDELYDTCLGILHMQERPRIALFVRADPFKRFVSCLVFAPRDRYDTALRKMAVETLIKALNGSLFAYYTQVSDSALARLHIIVRTRPESLPAYDVAEIEAQLVAGARAWSDRLRDALVEAHGEETGLQRLHRYADAFPTGYRETVSAEIAVFDIGRIEEVLESGRLVVNLYRPLEAEDSRFRFKVYHAGAPVPLSDILPLLENMDLRVITEVPFAVRPGDGAATVWIHDFETRSGSGDAVDVAAIREPFQDTFARVWSGRMESDGFNRLVIRAGLGWSEVTILRAAAKYLRQARIQFSQEYMEQTLGAHPAIARLLVELFLVRLDPHRPADWEARSEVLLDRIIKALDGVRNLEEDQILRRFVNLVLSVLRTNYFQRGADGASKPWLSFKLDSQSLAELPLPRPWVEVFVYSPRTEGIHLRGGRVARGGIRWSDRREDFRTEILGLMKAQMVKNAVIVPVGSKGGFVVKRPPAGREAQMAEGIECYRTLIRGLLDLTDTLGPDGTVSPPRDVVRLDGDDPYLVVAADKGTATFSDIANGVAREYGFWLDDAFASGGSAGYDHKRMAITARGAWESVKRHFRELGTDIQTQDFTCVGVGDMAGDVFGNGMLQSRHIRLIAAFNHQHIFCDPDPDPELSWQERERLFRLPRSAWTDYDPARLSAGGAVFERAAKHVRLSPQLRARFGIAAEEISPNELIRAILTAGVDLLWFGGIGTFVKARGETQADAGDRANDGVRVDAARLRARVIGEGANLGMTQLARIEAAQRGLRLNTDAIDNSGGVDCSDHEVNLKILFGDIMARGDLTLKQRDELLAGMTEEVARLVLADNYLQAQALSVIEAGGTEALEPLGRFMRTLEKAGRLDRLVERLPDDETLLARLHARQGLTRPELAVLLAYAKITLYDDLLESDLPDDPWMAGDLGRYFPAAVRERFPEAVARHRLRREIIATHVANSLVNRVGPGFVREMVDRTGLAPGDVARAYAVVRDAFGLRSVWQEIQALDGRIAAEQQIAMLRETQGLLERAVGWLLIHCPPPLDIAGEIGRWRPGVQALTEGLDGVLGSEEQAALAERAELLVSHGVPVGLAHRLALLPVLAAALDVVRIAGAIGCGVPAVAGVYFLCGERFGLNWLRRRAQKIKTGDHWQQEAVEALVDDLLSHQSAITQSVLDSTQVCGAGEAQIEQWISGRRAPVERLARLLVELKTAPALDLARLAVADRQVRALLGG
jgi:glutamate dehydrogenase